MKVAVDSSVLVALINPRDVWHDNSLVLKQALLNANVELIYFDCVAAETISAAARRLHEKRHTAEIEILLQRLASQVPYNIITWIMPDVPELYHEILELIRISSGELNFNDALIAVSCREREIPYIASFDSDFDQIAWLKRLAYPDEVIPCPPPT